MKAEGEKKVPLQRHNGDYLCYLNVLNYQIAKHISKRRNCLRTDTSGKEYRNSPFITRI